MGDVVLAVDSLRKQYAGVVAVDDCSLSLCRGEILGVIGPNGSGKTTLLNLISGVLPADRGTIRLAGQRIDKLPAYRRAQLGLSRTFQRSRVFDDLLIIENLLAGAPRGGDSEYGADVRRVAHGLGLVARLGERAGDVSFGLKRRVEFARAVLRKPKLLLLDELFSGIDPATNDLLMDQIRQVANGGTGVVVVDHDMDLVMRLCDRIVVLDQGAAIAEGTPTQIGQNPAAIAVYLGTAEASR